jgi:D-sedoheptulose 7-phosphate isomerase
LAVAAVTGGVEELYPFLYQRPADLTAVMEQVTRSTAEKAAEILELRTAFGARYGTLLAECASTLAHAFTEGGALFAFGNGGSSSDAAAVVSAFVNPAYGRPLPASCLTADVCALTALANDVSYEVVFARQIAVWGRPGDIAVGLSTSGGSANVLRAFEEACRRGMVTVGFAGYDGGKMAEAGTIDYLFTVPSSSVHRIQEAQTTAYHVLWELTQASLDPASSEN